jgi:hypothetical protein
MGEDLGVAGVGALHAEDRGSPLSAPQDLVHQRQLHLAVALAAEVGAEMTGPEAALFHLLLERVDHGAQPGRGRGVVVVRPEQVERRDFFAHELPHPFELGLELGLGAEVPRHRRLLPLGSCS